MFLIKGHDGTFRDLEKVTEVDRSTVTIEKKEKWPEKNFINIEKIFNNNNNHNNYNEFICKK